ncbi:MAG: ATP-grasp domain-containing protein [Bacteroidia bacterium]|nr:ATP-grasp domain-containing protein [Bacteroidia bacterium]MCO5253783.1 ATP-grasp domain-containing protein [Bacteroidota bacterium]
MTVSRVNILITGGGAPGAEGIIRCLREIPNVHITACDRNAEAYGKYLADAFFDIPDADHTEFIPTVLNICRKAQINLILPLVTRELIHFSNALNQFENENIKVLVSQPEVLKTANDKGLLYQTLIDNNTLAPDFVRVNNWQDMKQAICALGYPARKVIIKPCVSNGLRGFRIIDSQINELDLLLNHKPDSRYISLQKLEYIFSQNPMPDYVVSEYLPGEEYTVDVLAQNGKVLQIVPRLRLETKGGISTRGKMLKNAEIISYVTQIVGLLKMNWIVGVQLKKAENGSFKILEINPRVQGTTVACLGAGINFPKIAVELALQNHFEYQEPKWGISFFRHWNEVYF